MPLNTHSYILFSIPYYGYSREGESGTGVQSVISRSPEPHIFIFEYK